MLIMPSTKFNFNLNSSILVMISLILSGCGSFNSSSLVSADGIYSNNEKVENENSTSKYYENYFKEKALELENDFVFSDSILNNSDYISSNQLSYSRNNAAWGQIPDTKDYVLDFYSYRNSYYGPYGYYNYMYPGGYGYGYGYPFYSYFSMRNWYRYGWSFGYYPFHYDFYPYGWWGRTMPFGYRNRYSTSSAYNNNIYGNFLNRNMNGDVSYNDGRRGSKSNVVVYGNGKSTSTNGSSKSSSNATNVTFYNVGRPGGSLQNDSNMGLKDDDLGIRKYKDFVKENNTNSVTRSRTYARPEMGVGLSGNGRNSSGPSGTNESRRYYNNPSGTNSARGSKPVQYDWGLGGRNRGNSSGSQTRSYGNPSSFSGSSSSSSSSSRSYSTPSSSAGSFSRSSGPPSTGNVSSSSSSGSSSVGSGGRGSR